MQKSEDISKLSKNHLETLTSSQLIELADEYGIDIPDDLNRQFIIAELLEVAQEIKESINFKETITVDNESKTTQNKVLPSTYNETCIDVVVRNPVSIFVFWDYNEIQLRNLENQKIPVHLQICFFNSFDDTNFDDTFDLPLEYSDRSQYIIIHSGKKIVRVALIQECSNTVDNVLAISPLVEIPAVSPVFRDFQPGKDDKINPVLELSGIKNILKTHYNNYRQSFDLNWSN